MPNDSTDSTDALLHQALTPSPGLVDERRRAALKDSLLREFDRRQADAPPAGTGSRDGLHSVVHTAEVEYDKLPYGLRLADIEPITTQRASEVAERVVELLVERHWADL